MLSLFSHVQLFVSLWTVACQAPLSMGFSRQEYWSGLPFPSSGDLSNPGNKPKIPALQADSLPSELLGKPQAGPSVSSVHLLSCVRLFTFVQLCQIPWTAACQASLSITNPQSLLKLMCIKSVMPSNHLILCHPLLLLPSIFPSIGSFPMSQLFA